MKNSYKHTPEPTEQPDAQRKDGNRIKTALPETETPVQETEDPTPKAPKAAITDISFGLTRENMNVWMPWVLTIFAIGMFYIANSNKAQKTSRQIDQLNAELKELRSEYMTIKSDLEFRSNLSQLTTRLESEGLKPLKEPPRKIVVKKSK